MAINARVNINGPSMPMQTLVVGNFQDTFAFPDSRSMMPARGKTRAREMNRDKVQRDIGYLRSGTLCAKMELLSAASINRAVLDLALNAQHAQMMKQREREREIEIEMDRKIDRKEEGEREGRGEREREREREKKGGRS